MTSETSAPWINNKLDRAEWTSKGTQPNNPIIGWWHGNSGGTSRTGHTHPNSITSLRFIIWLVSNLPVSWLSHVVAFPRRRPPATKRTGACCETCRTRHCCVHWLARPRKKHVSCLECFSVWYHCAQSFQMRLFRELIINVQFLQCVFHPQKISLKIYPHDTVNGQLSSFR